jgi:hypothetical protein
MPETNWPSARWQRPWSGHAGAVDDAEAMATRAKSEEKMNKRRVRRREEARKKDLKKRWWAKQGGCDGGAEHPR